MWTLKIVELSFNKALELSVSFNHRLFTCTIAVGSGDSRLIHSINRGY